MPELDSGIRFDTGDAWMAGSTSKPGFTTKDVKSHEEPRRRQALWRFAPEFDQTREAPFVASSCPFVVLHVLRGES
jgi:hypothetical protein